MNEADALSHIVIMDQNGNLLQTLEGNPQASEVVLVGEDGKAKLHAPLSALLTQPNLSPPAKLPIPTGKTEKELFLGKLITPFICQTYNLEPTAELSSNPNDPPDLLLTTSSSRLGIELCELIYPERHLNDSLLRRFEEAIRKNLPRGLYSNYQLLLALKYATDGTLQLPKRGKWDIVLRDLIGALNDARSMAPTEGSGSLLSEQDLPESCRSCMSSVLLDNIGEPSKTSPIRPIIKFANYQQAFSIEELRPILSGPIEGKLDMKLTGNDILLIWSQHPSFRYCIAEICTLITELLLKRMKSPFVDVLYLHRSTENILAPLMINRRILVTVNDKHRPRNYNV